MTNVNEVIRTIKDTISENLNMLIYVTTISDESIDSYNSFTIPLTSINEDGIKASIKVLCAKIFGVSHGKTLIPKKVDLDLIYSQIKDSSYIYTEDFVIRGLHFRYTEFADSDNKFGARIDFMYGLKD